MFHAVMFFRAFRIVESADCPHKVASDAADALESHSFTDNGNPVLYRVDDGRPGGLDESGRPFSCSAGMVSPEVKKSWEPRLKALGNAITPQQAYAVGACIVAHEGMQAAPLTFYF